MKEDQPISPLSNIQNAVPNETTDSTGRYPDVYEVFEPGVVEKVTHEHADFLFQTENGVQLKVQVLNDYLFRFRYTHQRTFERDFSYAIDPQFQPTKTEINFQEAIEAYYIATPTLTCRVEKDGLTVTLIDKEGKIVFEDAQPYRAISTLLHGLSEVRITHTAHENEQYYGLGDKASDLNLRSQKKQNWNSDSFGYSAGTDPLYRTIPFYYSLHQGTAYGIFFDNPHSSHFDFDSQQNGKMSFFAEGGEMNYYFIYGPELLSVAERYTQLTGCPELPPLWALGFHQCRWSYYPEARVREIADTFRSKQIPCDAIYLDIDYMDGYRCFTWNKEHFPDPKAMISDLKADGFQTVVMIDPGLKVDDDYWVYESGLENEVYCERTSGELMKGPVWPPVCVFPDYTRPDVRAWWGKLYKELYNEQGVSGFWNDMNEPAVFKLKRGTFPDEVLHDYEGDLSTHAKAHNIYGLQMTRASVEGLKKLRPHKRPFLLTRASYSGGQRYAAAWTGDNVASWEHLRIANRQSQRMSISGFSFIGSDVGGFAGIPTGELMVRWMQLGIFHPFYRIHSMGNNVDGASETNKKDIEAAEQLNRLDQEPWSFGEEYEQHIKEAIELRYQLLPYFYTAFWQHTQRGTPMIRSLVFYDQQDEATFDLEREFMLGDHLLICPVDQAMSKEEQVIEDKAALDKTIAEQAEKAPDEDAATKRLLESTLEAEQIIEASLEKEDDPIKTQEIYLPKGEWYDFYSHKKYEGKQYIQLPVDLDHLFLFVKAGTVLPLYPVQQYVGEQSIEQLTLMVYAVDGTHKTELYEDEGEGYSYQEDDYCLRTFQLEGNAEQLVVKRGQEGRYEIDYETYKLCIVGLAFEVSQCFVDGRETAFQLNDNGNDNGSIEVIADIGFEEITIK